MEKKVTSHYKICAVCKKEFYLPMSSPTSTWKYSFTEHVMEDGVKKQKKRYCCSWSCYSKAKNR